MGRFRIDFTVREIDVPADDARGISFGDEVSAEQIVDFFNRCRDASRTLFAPGPPVAPQPVQTTVKTNITIGQAAAGARVSASAIEDAIERTRRRMSSMSQRETVPFPGDDGSRGGDGPMSHEAIAWYKAQMDPNRNRY
jgi:hypothetical protein